MTSESSNTQTKVLVVGGTGFAGSRLVARLLKENSIFSVDSLTSKEPDAAARYNNVKYHVANIADTDAVEKVLHISKPQVVFHMASPRAFVHRWPVYERVNVRGTRNLLDSCQKVGTVKAYIYTSTGCVVYDGYGNLNMVDETAPVLYNPEQKDPYTLSKALAEADVLNANRKPVGMMLTASLRLSAVFGDHDGQVITSMTRQAEKGQLKTQIGDGCNLIDWLHVDNVVHAHIITMQALLDESRLAQPKLSDKRVEGEAFFITNDDPRPFWDFARAVGTAAGYPQDEATIRKLPASFAYMIGFVAEWWVWIISLGQRIARTSRRSMSFTIKTQTFNIDKAKKRLGYKPIVSMDEGIKRSVTLSTDKRTKSA